MENSNLRNYISQWCEVTKGNPKQFAFYKAQLDAMKDVKVSKCEDVLTKHQIDFIRNVVKPKQKECYKNAMLVADALGCEYCDGYMQVYFGIEHAFNKVGDKYIDVTTEFALGKDPTQTEYATIGEYASHDALTCVCEMGMYDSVFRHKYIKSL